MLEKTIKRNLLVINNSKKSILKILMHLLLILVISCNAEKEEISYYEDGTSIKSRVNILNGNKEGKEFQYYRNGEVKFEINWINGRKHGYEREYYLNGNTSTIRKYKDGIIADTTFLYDESGKKLEEHYFDKAGMLMDFKHFDENGNQEGISTPVLRISSDTIKTTDTLYAYIKLGNIADKRLQSGVLFRGNNFIYDSNGTPIYLKDTLDQVRTNNNLYELKINLHNVGINHLRGIIVSHLGDTTYSFAIEHDYFVK